jgi:multidrug efflux pump subunit AcrB
MDIAKYSIKKPVITWLFLLFFLIAGWNSFGNLSRLEDPEFTIKRAKIIALYPGASAKEVEKELTDLIETTIQQMPQLKEVTSSSKPGMSDIEAEIKDFYKNDDLAQIWDELRKRLRDIKNSLPQGAYPPIVIDDFGDVYGILFAITGEGYSNKELETIAKEVRKELLLVKDVSKVSLSGVQKENIFVEISREKASARSIPKAAIISKISTFNKTGAVPSVKIQSDSIQIVPKSKKSGIDEIKNLLIGTGRNNELVYLKDIADIKRGYQEIPQNLIRYNGKSAFTIGVSGVSGVNIVALGKRIDKKLEQLKSSIPVGIDIKPIYMQHKIVEKSVNNFLINLFSSVAIVIVVLVLFMGARAGLLIGSILFLTVSGTLFLMDVKSIAMQRISLGALIIAMGMLVDNAVVVAEGIMIEVQKGVDRIKAASSVVKQTIIPLLGATIVGILAFAGIGLSNDATGEFVGSLFYVIMFSLLLSWYFAVTTTPLFCYYFFTPKAFGGSENKDPYDTKFFHIFRKALSYCLDNKKFILTILSFTLFLSVWGFGQVKQSFFPNSATPVFLIDYWKPQGTDIRSTSSDMKQMEKIILKDKRVKQVSSFIGQGATRMMLVYSPQTITPSYGQFFVETHKNEGKIQVANELVDKLKTIFTDGELRIKEIPIGPPNDFAIEARFSGKDIKVLKKLTKQAKKIFLAEPTLVDIRNDWRHKIKVINPVYEDAIGSRMGLSKSDVRTALLNSFSGIPIGSYKEKDKSIPIILRQPDEERLNINNIKNIDVWSSALNKAIPIEQVVSKFDVNFEEGMIKRRNRIRTLTVQANPKGVLPSVSLKRIKDKVEKIKLPDGYKLEWGGVYKSTQDAQAALGKKLPLTFVMMIMTVILLFGKIKQPLIIWLTVPMSIIGVTFGLLICDAPFSFMALLGFLSLFGMQIKNAIVLIDQMDIEVANGLPIREAIIESAVSRIRPVCMAAFTTILGMLPLLSDPFFSSMAITIMGGLAFATLLTLFIVPVLYGAFFKG